MDTLTVASRVIPLNAEDFGNWLDERKRALGAIFETVKEQVSEETIEPIVAARIISCVAGSVFGYEEFHPRAGTPPVEQLLEALRPYADSGASRR